MDHREPYYAVIFTSKHSETTEGYSEMATKMENLAKQQDGFLDIESAREDLGISISYWSSLEAINKWKQHAEHLVAQQRGKEDWYQWYKVRICKVERDYEFNIGFSALS